MEHLSSGTLIKRMKVCGNPRCHCASDLAARRGPYYEWSYLKGGKLRHRTLKPAQADLMRLATAARPLAALSAPAERPVKQR